MKKLLMLTALLLAVCAQAQVLKVAPRSDVMKSMKRMPAKTTITPTDDQMWWGYYFGDNGWAPVGTGKAETFDCAIFVPANHGFVGESTIKAIRFFLVESTNVSMAKVWISSSLPSEVDAADYVQSIEVSSLVAGSNDIILDTPYPVNNQAIYVGYSFTVDEPMFPIMQGGVYVPNALYLRSSESITEWEAVSYLGCLGLNLLIEGGSYPSNSVTPADFGLAVVEIGSHVDIPVDITNNGKDPVTSLSYTITSNGNTSEEKTIAVSEIPFSLTKSVSFPVEADATAGKVSKTLTITKVNGEANTADVKTATGSLTTVEKLKTWPRTVLIEEFTTEYCGYCPEAAAGLSSFMETYPDVASQVATVCHHAGFYTDWLTVDASKYYTWFYNDGGGTYAPAFMYDRYAWGGITPVENRQSGAEGYKSRVEPRLAVPSNVGIDLVATFNADKSKINVTAKCERCWDFSQLPARITLFLTEDNIEAHSQSGAFGSFTHQHVLRAVNETWGSELNWTNDKASYRYSFTLDSSWKNEDLKVIAFVSGYDSSNPANCEIENTAVCTIGDAPEELKGDVDGNGVFNLDDVTMTVSYLLGEAPDGFSLTAADMDENDTVDIVDITLMVEALKNVP